MFDSFGNSVRIKSSPETRSKGLDGKVGIVYGETTPSMMGFEIIGTPSEDFAINVFFEDLDTSFWFDANLLEKVDDGQGMVITLDGVDKKWTKGKNGEWIEEDISIATENTRQPAIIAQTEEVTKPKWWEFWK